MHESRSAKSPRNEMQHKDCNPSSTFLNYERGMKSEKPKTTETQINRKVIRVLFLGMTRVGKTSSIETLSKRLDRKTPQTPVYNHTRSGLNLKLVESPGFDENEEEIEEAISKSLSDCDPGPHVIIIVLSVGRFTPAAKKTMMLVQEKLGHNARKHILILFTREDNLEGRPIHTFIEENQDLREVVRNYENRFHAFNNRDTSNQTQVDELLHKIDEMYRKNKGEFYTNTATDKLMIKVFLQLIPDASSPGSSQLTPDASSQGSSQLTPEASSPGSSQLTPDASSPGSSQLTPDASSQGSSQLTPEASSPGSTQLVFGLKSALLDGAFGLKLAPPDGAFGLKLAPSDGASGLSTALPLVGASGFPSAACVPAFLSCLPRNFLNDFKFAPQGPGPPWFCFLFW
ncbi:GTPase IMAP family member 8-like [Trichomycterus rosablanca]|uniref:GTPase IMAP family member 8-like n=1 Tax=Trichomycterus rosablanca TaxID=2290929 RepID=UPI002F357B1E